MRLERPPTTLRLSVQYATARPVPPRDRIRRWVRAAVAGLPAATPGLELTLRFVDVDEGRALNRTFRGKDYATNVLTFPYGDEGGAARAGESADAAAVQADIVVCMPVVEKEAAEQHKDAMQHCAHLVIHGVLHAAGFDHDAPDDAAAMEAAERAALARFGIDDPYVARDDQPPGAAR